VKKFNENVLKKLALVILILSALIYFWPEGSSEIHTRRFCAYGELYVEFEHDNKVWGTTFLDSHGHPVPCSENEGIQENVRQSI
jgi:hypothetical protein